MKRMKSSMRAKWAVGMGFILAVVFSSYYMVQTVAAATPVEEVRGHIEGLLGGAIVDAALAETEEGKAQAQEALGRLIVTASLMEMRPSAIQQTTEVIPRYGETRGEVVFWPAASLGALLFIFVMLGLEWRLEAAMPIAGVVREFPVKEKKRVTPLPLAKAA